MKDGFTRKKVESLTLGERLRKLRTDAHIHIAEAARMTKIQAAYLEHLENGEYEKLPADVYVRGFLRSYARFLNVDEKSLIRLYERERNIRVNLGREKSTSIQPKPLSMFSFVITPRTILAALTILVVLGVFGYLYREFHSFAATPRLTVLEPRDGTLVEASETIIRGQTDRGARITINGEPVFVGDDGGFAEKLSLSPGLNTVVVSAMNRFDKEKRETLSVEARYEVSSPAPEENLPPQTNFSLEVSVAGAPTTVTIAADGETVFSGELVAGDIRHIEARERILISAVNGERVRVKFPDKEPESLLPAPGRADNIAYTAAGKEPASGL